MRKIIYPALILLVVVIVIVLVFFYISRISYVGNPTNATKFDIQPISKTNSFVGPVKDVLGVTFQHSFEIDSGISFSELGIYNVTVKSITRDKDTGYLEVTKENKTFELPLVGILSFKKIGSDSYEPMNVKDLGEIIEPGDLLTIHLIYISPSSTDSTKQIREKLLANSKGELITEEAKLWVKSVTNTGLTENEILNLISKNERVRFTSEQMTVHLIDLITK